VQITVNSIRWLLLWPWIPAARYGDDRFQPSMKGQYCARRHDSAQKKAAATLTAANLHKLDNLMSEKSANRIPSIVIVTVCISWHPRHDGKLRIGDVGTVIRSQRHTK